MNTPSEVAPGFGYDSRALAETYDRLSDLQFENGKELVYRLGPLDGARVLDVGCGTGRLARWIAERTASFGTVVGLDPLPQRVTIARTRAYGIRFEVGRAEDLSAFASESFDVVCMSSVYHWIADKPRALTEARRVLKPGGCVGMTTTSRELAATGSLHAVVSSVFERTPYRDRVRATEPTVPELTFGAPNQTTTELISTVLDSALELTELSIAPQRWNFASGRQVVGFLESSSFGNFLCSVPEGLRDRLRADLAAAFDGRKERDGIPLTMCKTLLVARRM